MIKPQEEIVGIRYSSYYGRVSMHVLFKAKEEDSQRWTRDFGPVKEIKIDEAEIDRLVLRELNRGYTIGKEPGDRVLKVRATQ